MANPYEPPASVAVEAWRSPPRRGAPVKQNVTLTIASLLTALLTTVHVTEDVLHDPAGLDSSGISIILLIIITLLIGTVQLAGRRSGYVIMLLGGLAAAYMPFLHGMGPRAIRWGFSFIWTLFALGVGGSFTAILSAEGLWRSFRTPATGRPVRPWVGQA
jgi:hypothetical protein